MRRITVSLILLGMIAALGSGCAARRKNSTVDQVELDADGQYRQGLSWLSRRKLPKAIAALSRIYQYTPESRAELEPLVRLALADATFYQGNDIAWIDSRSMYLDFVTLYSDHALAPYAQFQSGMCSLKQVRHPSRDQSLTHEAIGDLRDVERRYPNAHFATAAELMTGTAVSRLAEHEILVGRFYMKKKKYQASIERFRGALKRFPEYPDKDHVYLMLGQSLIRSDNETEGRIYLDKLLQDYPGGPHTKAARKELARLKPAGTDEAVR